MSIVNLYSKQQAALKGQTQDVYRHDELPVRLRNQIVQIWDDAIGLDTHPLSLANRLFEETRRTLFKEYGVFRLTDAPRGSTQAFPRNELTDFFLRCMDVERCL